MKVKVVSDCQLYESSVLYQQANSQFSLHHDASPSSFVKKSVGQLSDCLLNDRASVSAWRYIVVEACLVTIPDWTVHGHA